MPPSVTAAPGATLITRTEGNAVGSLSVLSVVLGVVCLILCACIAGIYAAWRVFGRKAGVFGKFQVTRVVMTRSTEQLAVGDGALSLRTSAGIGIRSAGSGGSGGSGGSADNDDPIYVIGRPHATAAALPPRRQRKARYTSEGETQTDDDRSDGKSRPPPAPSWSRPPADDAADPVVHHVEIDISKAGSEVATASAVPSNVGALARARQQRRSGGSAHSKEYSPEGISLVPPWHAAERSDEEQGELLETYRDTGVLPWDSSEPGSKSAVPLKQLANKLRNSAGFSRHKSERAVSRAVVNMMNTGSLTGSSGVRERIEALDLAI